jgi:hypothetical protein
MRPPNHTDDLVHAFASAPEVAEKLRGAQLAELAEFTQAESAALAVERKRLEAKYGAESPQARAAAARSALLDRERSAILAELDRRSIPTPSADPEWFIVFGRVVNAAGSPLREVTVTAVATTGAQLASASAGDRGAFELRVPVGRSEREGLIDTGEPRGAEKPTVPFHLQVSGPKTRLRYKSDEVFEAVGDRIAYREIVVPDNTSHGALDAEVPG